MSKERKNKIILVGDTGVGKTALVTQYTTNTRPSFEEPTIGAAHTVISFNYEGQIHKVQIWDTAGEEKYRSMTPIYSKGATGALAVFDLTRKATMLDIPKWIESIDYSGDIPIILVGNKSDLAEKREVTSSEGITFANELGFTFFETSAHYNEGVDNVFEEVIRESLSYVTHSEETITPEKVEIELTAPPEKVEKSTSKEHCLC